MMKKMLLPLAMMSLAMATNDPYTRDSRPTRRNPKAKDFPDERKDNYSKKCMRKGCDNLRQHPTRLFCSAECCKLSKTETK